MFFSNLNMDSTRIWDWSHTSQETTERQTGVENNPQYDALRDCSESLGQWQCLMRYLSNWIFIRRQCQHALGSGIQLFVELECMPAALMLNDWTRARHCSYVPRALSQLNSPSMAGCVEYKVDSDKMCHFHWYLTAWWICYTLLLTVNDLQRHFKVMVVVSLYVWNDSCVY